jgi:hypothetical protein
MFCPRCGVVVTVGTLIEAIFSEHGCGPFAVEAKVASRSSVSAMDRLGISHQA